MFSNWYTQLSNPQSYSQMRLRAFSCTRGPLFNR